MVDFWTDSTAPYLPFPLRYYTFGPLILFKTLFVIHKEGYRTISLVATLVVIIISALHFVLDWHHIIELLLIITSIGILGIVIWFFRNSDRASNEGDNTIISCVDGKVVAIEPVKEPEYFNNKKLIQVSVFMSPLNIHKNWWPANGSVQHYIHHNGKFRVAWHPKSSTENERSSIVLKLKNGHEIMIRQIAGALARRIVTYTKKGDIAAIAGEMGFIKFGSRIDILVPEEATIKVAIGDKAFGAKTIIATFDE